MKLRNVCHAPELNRTPGICSDRCNQWDIPMRSKLAILRLSFTSLFGSTLIASAQTQTAPGASSAGTVSPGATSAKKTQHEKGMTTGAGTHSGANKSGTMAPSVQTTLVPAPITWLLRKAAASIDVISRGGCTSREQKAPEQFGALPLFGMQIRVVRTIARVGRPPAFSGA